MTINPIDAVIFNVVGALFLSIFLFVIARHYLSDKIKALHHFSNNYWLYGLKLLFATALYTFSSRYLLDFFAPSGVVSLFYIASGIGLSTVLIGGNRYAASIFLGQTVSVMLGGLPLATAMGMGAGCTLGTIAGVSWLRHKTNFNLSLTTLSDWLQLILWGGCFMCGINAVVGVSSLLLGGFVKPDEFFSKIMTWWLGDMLGVMVITPFALTWWQVKHFSMTRKQCAEVLLLVGLTFLVGLVVFLDWFHLYVGQIVNTYWMFLLIIWVAVRLEAHWVSLIILITSIQALQGVYSDLGIFNSDFTQSKELNYWFYIIVLSSVGITLSTFITTIKQAQYLQEEALNRLQKIASRVPGMVYSFRLNTDGSACFPYASSAIQTIYRVLPEDVQENAASVFAILHPDDYEHIVETINVSAQNLTPWQLEYRVQFADGTVRWLYGNALPQREDSGSTLWHGFITDITDTKQAQLAERQQHDLLINVINSLSHPFYVVNTDDYTVQLANEGAGEWLRGKTTCYQLGHKKNFPCIAMDGHPCPIKEVKRTKKPLTLQHLHINKDNEQRIAEIFAYPIFDETGEVSQIIEYVIDVTERVQTEAALRDSENKLNTILDSVEAYIYIKDCNYQYQYANLPMRQLFGQPLEAIIGKTDKDFFDSATAINLRQNDSLVIECGERLATEEVNVSNDGSICTAYQSVKQPLRREDGSIYALCGISTDITNRKLSEVAMAESQKLLRTIIDTTPMRVFWKDCNLRYLGCNTVFAQDAGMTNPNDLIGKDDYQMGWADQAALYRADDLAVMESGISKLSYDEPQTTPSGETIWLRTSKVPLKNQNDEIIGLLGVYEDITEYKQQEEILKANEARFRAIIEISPVPMALNDEYGNINFLNPAFVQTFGYDVSDIPTLDDWWSKAYPDPDYRQWVAKSWQAAVEQSEREHTPFRAIELTICCKNAVSKTVLISAAAIQQSFKELHLVIMYDITERKQIEAELHRSNADLEQFAYAVSHDMRQPLRMITSYLALIETALATQLDEDTQQFLTFALEGAKRMDAMILSLLDYSRVGRRSEALSIISSRAAVNEALTFLEPDIKASAGHVEVTGEWTNLYGSPDELTRLLQNLISNALKYHEENKPPCVEVRATVTANTFKVEVRDSGIGIDPSQANRLFKVFSRLHARTRFEGTGVGLALCRKIVEHHGGQIGVQSEGEGHGSVFWFELPRLQPKKLNRE